MTIFEAKFSGLFRQRNQRNAGLVVYHDIHWEHLFITNPIKSSVQDIEQLKAGDYWYKEKIRDQKWYRFFLSTTEILIAKQENTAVSKEVLYYQGDLLHVVIRDFETNPANGLPQIRKVSQEHYEMYGTIYFGIQNKPPQGYKIEPTPSNGSLPRTFGEGINFFLPSKNKLRVQNVASNQHNFVENKNLSTDQANVSVRRGAGCLSLIGNIFAFIFWIGALYYLWYSVPWLFWTIIGIGILWLFSKLFEMSCIKNILNLLLIGFLLFYWMGNFKSFKQQLNPEDQGEGNVKILPPREDTENPNSNEKDYVTEKQINWWDFIKNNYQISYNTSSLKFLDVQKHNTAVGRFQGQNEVEIYTRVYNHMITYDGKYIDSVIFKLKQRATEKKLNKLQQAEMVTTMIQEIPYCLVHDLSCQDVVLQSGEGFVKEYHEDGGPCLPGIPAGLQSPYQFLHNLKGDCDTRSLLGHLLLTRLGIGSSVWISTEYGHSVLGVALPVGSGSYKSIRGVKHYAVELTAKGFMLGMIAPEQRNMNNWYITLYKQ